MGLLQLTGALVFFDGGGDRRREARPLVVREGYRGVVVIFLFLGSFVLFGLDSCPYILYVRICTRIIVFKAARRAVARHSFKSPRRRLGEHKAWQGDAV